MRERFPGHYRPTEEEFAELWAGALIVPDTNVLLSLYRLPERTRVKLLEILGRLQDRLFVPHQVAVEFQRHRIEVIEEQVEAYGKVSELVEGFAAKVGAGLRRHPQLEKADIEARINEALAPVGEHLEELRQEHPAPLGDGDPLGTDSVRDALDRIFAGRLGPERDLAGLVEDGSARYEAKRPPGYEDAEKAEPDRYGDLAIWLDVLAKAEEAQAPVILVTEEDKEDWWWKRGGKTLGPRRELVEEMAETAGQRFYLYKLDRFMEAASTELGLEFSPEERDEVIAARAEPPFDPATTEWRIDHDLRRRAEEAAGIIAPDRQPTRFEPSPASGFSVYEGAGVRQGIPPSPVHRVAFYGDGPAKEVGPDGRPPGWRADARERSHGAELEIYWEPRPSAPMQAPGAQLTCLVISASGEQAGATVAADALAAYVRFPDDFRHQGQPAPGTYAFEWYFQAPGATSPVPVAMGSFLIKASGAGD